MYLLGPIAFQLVTDHQASKYVFQKKDIHGRIARWRGRVAEYRFEVVYCPDRRSHAADFLSGYAGMEHGFDEDADDLAFPITDPEEQTFSGLEPYYPNIGRYTSGMKLDEPNAKLWVAIKRNS